MIANDIAIVLPELSLVVLAMAGLMTAVYTSKDGMAPLLTWLSAIAMVVVAGWIGLGRSGTEVAFNGAFVDDGFARFAKVVALLSAAAVLLMSEDYLRRHGMLKFELPVLILFAVVGMMMMISAGDLMALYMGVELQSLALYVVAAFRRDSVRSTEAGLKYFVLGALASGMLLYGASLTYGYAGTTSFDGIAAAIGAGPISMGLLFGLVFMLVGLAFKVSAAPFHMWTPDVYEGSPTPVTAFFATAPKVAAIAMFARIMHDAFAGVVADWQQIVAVLALLSMFVGAIAGVGQRDIKRLMAYSSIAHMGFALLGLAAGTAEGLQALLFYLAVYVTMNVGTFAFILSMERDGRPVTEIAALSMYSRAHPGRAYALAALLFSMAGVPPLVGFFPKFMVLAAAVNAGLTWLAIAGVIASVIAAYYYLRIVYLMFFGEPAEAPAGAMSAAQWVAFVVSAVVMVVGVVNLFGVDAIAAAAAATLVH